MTDFIKYFFSRDVLKFYFLETPKMKKLFLIFSLVFLCAISGFADNPAPGCTAVYELNTAISYPFPRSRLHLSPVLAHQSLAVLARFLFPF
jgi:hypothetical protein